MWKPGDTALCIDPRPYDQAILKEGSTYTVADVEGSCCQTRLVLKECPTPKEMKKRAGYYVCIFCRKDCEGFCAWRFIKIAGDHPSVHVKDDEEIHA